MRPTMRWLAPIVLLLVAGCSSPESECRDGIAEMNQRVSAMMGSGELRDAASSVQAQLDVAQARLTDGEYPECVESVKRARAALVSSQRTNQ